MSAPAWPARRLLVVVWATAAIGLGILLAFARGAEGPLDDPDPAQQRPGFLDLGNLPRPAPRVTARVPRAGRRAVVIFERPGQTRDLCRALRRSDVSDDADVVVVVAGEAQACSSIPLVADPSRRLAGAFGMRRPRDGGAPVGYAIVDSKGRIRYRTIDPSVADELGEVQTILAAVP